MQCLETARAWPTRPFDCQQTVISTAHFVRRERQKEKKGFFPLFSPPLLSPLLSLFLLLGKKRQSGDTSAPLGHVMNQQDNRISLLHFKRC